MGVLALVLAGATVVVGAWLTLLFLRGRRPAGVWQAAHAGFGAAAVGVLGVAAWTALPLAFGVLAASLGSGALFWLFWRQIGISRGLVLLSHAVVGLAGALMLAVWVAGPA